MKAFSSFRHGWGMKACGIIGVASVLSALLSPVTAPAQSKAPASSTEQPQGATTGQPTAAELEGWRKAILATPRPTNGCFTATYPEKQWHEVACKTPPHKAYPSAIGQMNRIGQVGGNGGGFQASVTGAISSAEGSFDTATVTSECAVQCPYGICPANPTCTGADPANTYSLQLNTNNFTTTCLPPASGTCVGWEQFIYDSTSGSAGIQYWLYGGSQCPTPQSSNCPERGPVRRMVSRAHGQFLCD
jgi:hypothetical protein